MSITVFGEHDENTLQQFAGVSATAVHSALMPDGHFGYWMPVGGVAAYRNQVSVSGVGYDIACGNCAIRTNIKIDHLPLSQLGDLADTIQGEISFGVGRKNNSSSAPVDHPLFSDPRWDHLTPAIRDPLKNKAREQLGTVGSGNHYVDVLYDEFGNVWVGVHFGSRGFGHTIASGFLALAAGEQWGAKVHDSTGILNLNSALGEAYWDLMQLAGEYAYAGRNWVAEYVVKILGGVELDRVHNNHNFAWKEVHSEEELVVVRKGATPAYPGQRGFVGGSMGDDAVIIEGDIDGDRELQKNSLFSTVHGAGRVMSRSQAKGKTSKSGEVKKIGEVTSGMMLDWMLDRKTILRGGGVDESPHVYRRLNKVLEYQKGIIKVTNVLRPKIVVMAGANEYDPYGKD